MTPCYPFEVQKRLGCLVLVLAVAFGYATAMAGAAPPLRAGAPAVADESPSAVCPATRPSSQLGRQVEGRSGMPLAVSALPPEEQDGLSIHRWARNREIVPSVARPKPSDGSSWSPRGPPKTAFRYREAV